jgi:hypothetical protein
MSQIKREPIESEDSSHSVTEWSLDTSTIGEGNDVNELKLKMAVLEVCICTFIIRDKIVWHL